MNLRVFLVEDLHRMRSLIADLFASMGGYEIVGTATTEAEAKLWLDNNFGGWELAIIDLVLDQGTGMGVISHAKKIFAKGKLVVFSSYASPAIRAHCLALGADAVFDNRKRLSS